MNENLVERQNEEQMDLSNSQIKYGGKKVTFDQLDSEMNEKIKNLNSIAFNKYLIIGTCVRLNISSDTIMIIGYNYNQNGENYDYIGCVYPNGIGEIAPIIFNHEQIERIYYIGYTTEIGNKYKKSLNNCQNKI